MEKEALKLQVALTNNIKNAQTSGRCTNNADEGKKSVRKKSLNRRKETGDLVR